MSRSGCFGWGKVCPMSGRAFVIWGNASDTIIRLETARPEYYFRFVRQKFQLADHLLGCGRPSTNNTNNQLNETCRQDAGSTLFRRGLIVGLSRSRFDAHRLAGTLAPPTSRTTPDA